MILNDIINYLEMARLACAMVPDEVCEEMDMSDEEFQRLRESLTTFLDSDKAGVPFEIEDVLDDNNEHSNLKGGLCVTNRGVHFTFEGYGDYISEPGHGVPLMVEYCEGSPRVVAWNDINQEDHTDIVYLDGAKETRRLECQN